MRRRDPAKAITMLDAMLEYFDGGRRWTQCTLADASGQHRCLIGALRHVRHQQRIYGAGTEHYLRAALTLIPDSIEYPPDLRRIMAQFRRSTVSGVHDLMRYNDECGSYEDLHMLITEARAEAQAELDAAGNRRRTTKRCLLAQIELEKLARPAAGDVRSTT